MTGKVQEGAFSTFYASGFSPKTRSVEVRRPEVAKRLRTSAALATLREIPSGRTHPDCSGGSIEVVEGGSIPWVDSP
jgi:hypothetical protein